MRKQTPVASVNHVTDNINGNGGTFKSNHQTKKNYLVVDGKEYRLTKNIQQQVIATAKVFGKDYSKAFVGVEMPSGGKGNRKPFQLLQSIKNTSNGYLPIPVSSFFALAGNEYEKARGSKKGQKFKGYEKKSFNVKYDEKSKSVTITLK
jgi:hypothetical protein